MSRGQNDIFFRTQFHQPDHLGNNLPPFVAYGNPSALPLRPPVSDGGLCRKPDTSATPVRHGQGLFGGKHVDLRTERLIQGDGTEHLHARYGTADSIGHFVGIELMAFQHHSGHTSRLAVLHILQCMELAPDNVWSTMYMHVDGAFQIPLLPGMGIRRKNLQGRSAGRAFHKTSSPHTNPP